MAFISNAVVFVTRRLARDGGMAEDHGAPEDGKLSTTWTKGRTKKTFSAPINSRLNVMVRSPTPFGMGRKGFWPSRRAPVTLFFPSFNSSFLIDKQ